MKPLSEMAFILLGYLIAIFLVVGLLITLAEKYPIIYTH
jgi:hypothetical protein